MIYNDINNPVSKWSDQQLFDYVAEHLLTQGVQASDQYGTCCYRDDSGKSCAVGCLIPNALYNEEFEGMAVLGFVDELMSNEYRNIGADVVAFLGLHGDTLNNRTKTKRYKLLNALQIVHDISSTWGNGEVSLYEELKSVAKRFKLRITPTKEVYNRVVVEHPWCQAKK